MSDKIVNPWLGTERLQNCRDQSVGDKKHETTKHSLLGLPTAMHAAQKSIFFQPRASFSGKREP